MSDRPTGAELLAEARRALLEELLPLLSADRRYDGLMIANAMAIAARELASGDVGDAERRAALERLYGGSSDGHETHGQAVLRHERQMARDIRAGAFDSAGERRDVAQAYLRKSVLTRLAISNPKALPESRKR